MISRQRIACWFNRHDWKTTSTEGCVSFQQCRECGETRMLGWHAFGAPVADDSNPCRKTVTCTACHASYVYDAHDFGSDMPNCRICSAPNPNAVDNSSDYDTCGYCGRTGYGTVCPYCISNYNR